MMAIRGTTCLWRQGARIGIVGLGLLWAISAHAATTIVHEDFEDGRYTGTKSRMAVAPKILEEHGNKFLRITGSASDKDGLAYCHGTCPKRTRSTIAFTTEASLDGLPAAWTYSADIRLLKLQANAWEVNPISITVNTPGGYCGQRIQVFGRGRSSGSKRTGHYYFDRRLHGVKGSFNVDLGAYAIGAWQTIRLDAVWSKNPQVGRMALWINGKLKKTWRGNTHPSCGWFTPEVRYGLYGDASTGILDLDNIHIHPTGRPLAPPVTSR